MRDFPFEKAAYINENRTLAKTFLAEMVMASLALEGRKEIVVSREQLEDEVWRDIVVSSHLEPVDRSLHIRFRFANKSLQAIADANAIADADYEIVEDTPQIAGSPKQIGSGPNA